MDDLILKCNQSIMESQAALARCGEIQGELKSFRSTDDHLYVPKSYRSLLDLRPISNYYVARLPKRRPRVVPVFYNPSSSYGRPILDREWMPVAHSSPKTNRRRYCFDTPTKVPLTTDPFTTDHLTTDQEDQSKQKSDNHCEVTEENNLKKDSSDIDSLQQSEIQHADKTKEDDINEQDKIVKEKELPLGENIGKDETSDMLATSAPKKKHPTLYQRSGYRSLLEGKYIKQGMLHHAVVNGDIGVVQSLILDGANVNEIDGRGMTALHHAVDQSHYGIINLLLSNNEVQVNLTDSSGKTPLIYAVESGLTQVVIALLKHGSYVNSADFCKQTCLHKACLIGKHNIVDVLLEHGASVYTFDEKMKAPLHYAVENNHTTVVTTMLRRGTPVDQSDGIQQKPLHYVAQLGLFTMADILLENGATVDALNKDLKTPLFIAVENDLLSLVKTFISCDASVNTADADRLTPLHVASLNGNVEMVTELVQRGARLDTTDCTNRTPLSYAVETSEADVVQILLLEGASTTVVDCRNKTPLHYAVENDDQLLIKMLANHELSVAKSEHVYWRLLGIAFDYEDELLGEIAINDALAIFVEKVVLQKSSHHTQENVTVLMKSLLIMICKQFSKVHNGELLNVWAGYKEDKEDRPLIIADVSTYPISRRKEYMGVPVVYCLNPLMSDEAVILNHSKDEIDSLAVPLEIIAAQRAVQRNEARLKLKHSNLLKVSISPVRSLENGTLLGKETCIVMHCKNKGMIPFGEKRFPESVDGFPVDVREGVYNLYTEPSRVCYRLASPRLLGYRESWLSRIASDYDERDDLVPLDEYLTDYELDYMERRIRKLKM